MNKLMPDSAPDQEWIKYRLRPMEPRDNDVYRELLALSPETGMITVQSIFKADPYEIFMQRQQEQMVVVAELPEGGVVGTAVADARPVWFEGQAVQAVHLFGVQVHPDYRRRGVATALTQWRISWASKNYGTGVLVFAEIDEDNLASFRNASKWSNGLGQPRESGFIGVLRHRPRPIASLIVKEANETDYPDIVKGLNEFNQEVDFTRYSTVERLRRNLAPLHGKVYRHRYVAVREGEIVGGAVLTDPDPALETRLIRAPQVTKWFARLSGMIHVNGVIQGGEIDGIWYKPGEADAVNYVVNTMRYQAASTAHALIVRVTNPKAWKALQIAHWQPYRVQSVAYLRPATLKGYEPPAAS